MPYCQEVHKRVQRLVVFESKTHHCSHYYTLTQQVFFLHLNCPNCHSLEFPQSVRFVQLINKDVRSNVVDQIPCID